MQLLKYLLANGSMEYKSAKEEKGILAGDERELEEPLLANLLHGKVSHILAPCKVGKDSIRLRLVVTGMLSEASAQHRSIGCYLHMRASRELDR